MNSIFNFFCQAKAPRWTVPLLLFISFATWVLLCRSRIFGIYHYGLDAMAYYDHFRTFILNIRHGTYPLWDPARDSGTINEFALRRIGEFNPFYGILTILSFVIPSFDNAYNIFLAIYFFIGCLGFYLLCKRLYASRVAAFVAFLLLFFSSVGLREFYCFFLLIFTPLMWFAFFFVSFSKNPQRWNFLGMITFLCVLLSTYVPAYFVVIFGFFLIIFCCLYPLSIVPIASGYVRFMRRNVLLTLFSILLVVSSVIPTYLFFKAGQSKEFVMPNRSRIATDRKLRASKVTTLKQTEAMNALKVKPYSLGEQGIIIPMVTRDLIADPRGLGISQLFFPFFAIILFLAGAVLPVSRRMLLFALWFFSILLIGQNEGTPIMPFLYDHVFIFRYFRNVYLFLWMALAPLFVFFICDFLLPLFRSLETDAPDRRLMRWFLYFVHVAFAACLIFIFRHRALSSYISILLSLFLFEMIIRRKLYPFSLGALSMIWLAIALQPIEGYSKTIQSYFLSCGIDRKASLQARFSFINDSPANRNYLQNQWLGKFLEADDPTLIKKYTDKLVLFDRLVPTEDDEASINKILKDLSNQVAFAYVPATYTGPLTNGAAPRRIALKKNSALLSVTFFNYNVLRLKTDFPIAKFLVYNENYHSEWRVFIDGKKAELVRANVAFKGVWVPAGQHQVVFRFGKPLRYAVGWFTLIGTYSAFLASMVLFRKTEHESN
jgi:hypothetical protein